jgi:alpha-beta hydrolase superfamily lysophospholipase
VTQQVDPVEVDFNVDVPTLGTVTVCGAATVTAAASNSLHVLLHGGTYNRWYWDPDVDRDRYSYVVAAARRGVSTLNLDLLGRGASSRPPGDRLGLTEQATAVACVLEQLRHEGMCGARFANVSLVGHSLGSATIVLVLEASAQVDAAVITGFTRRRVPGASGVEPYGGPATADPRFGDESYRGYHTLAPGSRPFFYYLPTAQARMLASDERHRDVTARAELEELVRDWEIPSHSTVPVLVAVGEHDFTYSWPDPRAFAEAQRNYFPAASVLDTLVVPDTGHNLALHGRGPQSTTHILDWLDERTGDADTTLSPNTQR